MNESATPLAFAVNSQKDIHEAEPRLESEAAAFIELREVLVRHGLEQKYGLTLLHKHFDLAENEIMVEFTDLENRTLTSKPFNIDTISESNFREVTWSLARDTVMGACVQRCFFNRDSTPQHVGQHRYEN